MWRKADQIEADSIKKGQEKQRATKKEAENWNHKIKPQLYAILNFFVRKLLCDMFIKTMLKPFPILHRLNK